MHANKWVVVARVGESAAAKRTDSCGDMEELELMEFILVSEHKTKVAAQQVVASREAQRDGWVYLVMTRRDYETRARVPSMSTA